jgi:hypothetical protein
VRAFGWFDVFSDGEGYCEECGNGFGCEDDLGASGLCLECSIAAEDDAAEQAMNTNQDRQETGL